jgi:hypothetical protein
LVLGAFCVLRAARTGAETGAAVRLSVAFSLVVWIATNKVWSPQYALYGFLAGALAGAPLKAFLALSALSVADYHLAFEVRALNWEPLFRDWVWEPENLLRTVTWLLFALWILKKLVARRSDGDESPGEARPSQ